WDREEERRVALQERKDLKEKQVREEGAKRENLSRWIASGHPSIWVTEHNCAWNHSDWLSLLELLRSSQYWPVELDRVGLVLEQLKDKRCSGHKLVTRRRGRVPIRSVTCECGARF